MAAELVQFETDGPIVIARVHGTPRLDYSNAEMFGQALQGYVLTNPGCHMLVSLAGIEFISSAVLSELIQTMRDATKDAGSLRVCALSDYVASVFEATHLDKAFKVLPTVAEAVESYKADVAISGGG
jgi:anti-anti-sigma factor